MPAVLLMAMLPWSRAWVFVGPPLSDSGPRCGSPLILPSEPPLLSSIRLPAPANVAFKPPTRSPPVLLATIVLLTGTTVVAPSSKIPPD